MSVNSDNERLAHELLFVMEEMRAQQNALNARMERIATVIRGMRESLLPSTVSQFEQAWLGKHAR